MYFPNLCPAWVVRRMPCELFRRLSTFAVDSPWTAQQLSTQTLRNPSKTSPSVYMTCIARKRLWQRFKRQSSYIHLLQPVTPCYSTTSLPHVKKPSPVFKFLILLPFDLCELC